MEKQSGWDVTRKAFGLDTAFVCVFSHNPSDTTPVISYNAEYDALPGIGHACGHNLITACGVTAALSTALAMKKFNIAGIVKLFGTPAEEGGGGKCKLLEAHAFDGCDVSMMGHGMDCRPTPYLITNATQRFTVEFFGKEAHAAASPWQGVNALDAMVILYNAVSVLRQQLKPTDIVQLAVNDGGTVPNIITGYSKAEFSVRAPTVPRLREVQAKVFNCVKAGALASGCKYRVKETICYYNNIVNDVLAERFTSNMNSIFGHSIPPIEETRRNGESPGSTDQSNISWEIPSIHALFELGGPGVGPHTKPFAEAAGTREGYDSSLQTGMSLGLIGLELLQNPELLAKVKEQFKADIKAAGDLTKAVETVESLESLIYTE
ncbi:CYFA0S19e01266g1_1 [Cyberlindnera fabianii]|uniref:Peptidase M20 domain-containing protein 2 n=1 Tax=Cyberlindnera fabianii TaxID=36022 RepID=A0A061BCP7_CYBFA|nr:CYFA0S19e01266g1_1 [Cyberlindnera fabianii]